MRTLAITGDDFGLTPGVNTGIMDAHLRGVLTHASLMASAPFVDEATALAVLHPSLGVGLHVVLVDGRPVLSPRDVPTLVTPDGAFRVTPFDFVRDWVLGRIALDEVEREVRAQVAVMTAAGLRPTHIDSHKHVHLWPPVFDVVAKTAARHGIQSIRVPFEQPMLSLVSESLWIAPARKQAVGNALTAPLAVHALRELERRHLSPRWFLGRVYTGMMTESRLEHALRRMPPGVGELMTHPGYPDEELARVRTRLRLERAADVELLCAVRTRELLRRTGVTLADRAACGG